MLFLIKYIINYRKPNISFPLSLNCIHFEIYKIGFAEQEKIKSNKILMKQRQ